MHKLMVLACLVAVAAIAQAQFGHHHTGYGYVGGLTKLPNLGFGNIAKVNHHHNALGYGYGNFEAGPLSVRSHVQTAHAPLGVGIPVLHGFGHGFIG